MQPLPDTTALRVNAVEGLALHELRCTELNGHARVRLGDVADGVSRCGRCKGWGEGMDTNADTCALSAHSMHSDD